MSTGNFWSPQGTVVCQLRTPKVPQALVIEMVVDGVLISSDCYSRQVMQGLSVRFINVP